MKSDPGFAFSKAGDAGGLSPGKYDNVAKYGIARKDGLIFKQIGYITPADVKQTGIYQLFSGD